MTIKETIEEAKKVGVKDMSWKAWFMIITIISAATVASYYGVNVTMNLDLANRVDTLEGMLSHTINSTFYTLQKQASYIISTVTSGATTYYCMQNGTDGTLQWYSTNFSQVMGFATGNLSSIGGGIFVRNGDYSADSSIPIYSGITIQGENKYYTNISMATNDVDLFTNGSNLISHFVIKDLQLYGRKSAYATDIGCAIKGAFAYSLFQNLNTWRFGTHIWFRDYSTDGAWDNGIKDSYLHSSVSHGVYFGAYETDNVIENTHIEYADGVDAAALYINGTLATSGGHRFTDDVFDTSYYNVIMNGTVSARFTACNIDQSDKHGVYIIAQTGKNPANISFMGGKISKASKLADNTYSGIYLQGISTGDSNAVESIQIIGVNFLKGGAGTGLPKYCIEVAGVNERDITIQGNDFRWGYSTAPLSAVPTSSIVGNNEGLWMSQSGSNTTATDGGVQLFPATMAFTPTFVFVVSGNSSETVSCAVTSISTAGFTYNLHDDNGTAVTGQTVYWEAKVQGTG